MVPAMIRPIVARPAANRYQPKMARLRCWRYATIHLTEMTAAMPATTIPMIGFFQPNVSIISLPFLSSS